MNPTDSSTTGAPPPGLVDLAAARLGGTALLANDEFFAEKENLLKPGRGIFIADKYTDRGKWMDGWETRRRRTPGHDWCVVQLGLRGMIKQVDIDTNHFLGNHPPFASLDAVCLTNGLPKEIEALPWTAILDKSPLNPGSQNLFAITSDETWTHVRLNIFPDGGVARLRVYGIVVPDWSKLKADELVDLAAVENGGVPLACSDMFFSSMNNLIMPGRSENMGDGWETKRRRGPGHDWIVLKLGLPGTSPPHRPKSTSELASAAARFNSKLSRFVVGGCAFNGISNTVVVPPAAAARDPVAKPSQSVRPGSLK